MSAVLVVTIMVIYFGILITISIITSRGADTNTFFTANRQSPWFLVAFGMIGSSLSGVTFISVPGNVAKTGFGYFQIVLGYLIGYWIIIGVLMPLYYRLNLISIYTYLEKRFNFWSYKTGAFLFLISRTIGSSLRLFIAAAVLQTFLFNDWHVPFFVTVAVTIGLIWLYTFKGGVKTIVWTDSFQTIFLISAVCIAVWQITNKLDWSFSEMTTNIMQSHYAKMFYTDNPKASSFFIKQILGGMFITVAMTGLDQEIMQKNLTCKNLGEAQKNMFWFSIILVMVNLLFLVLGALLYLYSTKNNIAVPASSDELFPTLARYELGLGVGIFFLLGITASSYASADSALAGLTTSFCIDFLNFKSKDEATRKRQKFIVHLAFSVVFLIIILIFKEINERAVIDAVLTVAGYTYGPLLGLFAFGVLTKRQVRDKLVPFVCLMSIIICLMINPPSQKIMCEKLPAVFCDYYNWRMQLLNGYEIGLELLGINGLITFIGLWLISRKSDSTQRL
jgi:SSS family transporter